MISPHGTRFYPLHGRQGKSAASAEGAAGAAASSPPAAGGSCHGGGRIDEEVIRQAAPPNGLAFFGRTAIRSPTTDVVISGTVLCSTCVTCS